MAEKNKRINSLLNYTLAGVIFGFIFPVGATIMDISLQESGFSWNAFNNAQQSNPLLWIIDSAPVFLGIFAYIAGVKQQKLQDQSDNLEELVEKRSKETIRQKVFFEALIQNSPIAVVTLDENHLIVSVNPAFQDMFGFHKEEIIGKELDELVANPERPQEANRITQSVLDGQAMHEYGQRRRKDGKLIDVEIFGQPISINGNQVGALGMYRDITAEKQAQEALSASEERFRRMFSDSPVALRMEDLSLVKRWINEKIRSGKIDLRNFLSENPDEFREMLSLAQIIDLNAASLLLFNAGDKQELQKFLNSILSCESTQSTVDIICSLMDGKTTQTGEMIYQLPDGQKIFTITKLSIMPGYEESWGRVLFSNMDISERKLAEERLTYISLHDMMTGIYNRAYFEEEMGRLDKGRLHPISILVSDMDNLKSINDRNGHQAGDLALQTIAGIVKNCFRSEDVVARIGGDEIAALLPGMDADNAEKAKGRILVCIEQYNQENSPGIPLSLSIGCATAEKGKSLDEVFKLADERMYQEKQQKKAEKKT